MEFTYLFKALLRRKWIIIVCVLLATGAAYLFTKNQKKQFESTTQFSTGFTLSEEIKMSNENFNIPQIDLKFNNVIENITSPKVLTLISYCLMLHDLEPGATPFTRLSNEQKRLPQFNAVDPQKAVITITGKLDSTQVLTPTVPDEKKLINFISLYNYDVESLAKLLTVSRYQRTDYINIACKSESPSMSAFIVNKLFEQFKRFYGLDKRERSDVPMATLDTLMRQKKALLDQKILEKTKFMSAAGVVDVTMEGSSALSQKNSYENQLIEEKSIQQNESYRVQQLDILIKAARDKGVSSITAPKDITTNIDRSEYTRLRKQYNDLYNTYIQNGGSDPEMKKRLDNIQASMNKLNLADSASTPQAAETGVISVDQLVQKKLDADAQLQASNQKIASIQTKIDQLNGGLNGMAAKGANIQQFDKEIDLASSEYKDAKEKLNQALNLNETMPGNFKQTLVGQPALHPEPSKRPIIMGLAGAIAFILSSLVVILIEFFDQSIKTPSHFIRLTNLPLLGLVNLVKFDSANILERVTYENEMRNNTFRELLRKLRYEIEISGKKIFLFTSTRPQQGKTSLIQAIAYSLSLGKKKVLIIDTNFCNNDLTKSIHANPVLEKFNLNGHDFNAADLSEFVTQTQVNGIDIIGCEGGDYTPSEILPKNHLLNYLGELKNVYDCIFMEGAPLNGFTDTKELLKYADALIAIFAAETVLTPADKESIAFLEENRDKFLGAILNKVPESNLDL
jgi:polysaccharide biosynthesis transport protein